MAYVWTFDILGSDLPFRQIMTEGTDYAFIKTFIGRKEAKQMDDYHTFESTNENTGGGGGGCLPWVIGFLVILWLCSR